MPDGIGHARGMLRLVLPKGSLENATLDLFLAADLAVKRTSDVDYRASIDDPRVREVRILRPQEIPIYVAEGLFDLGITGRDWIEETGADVISLGELKYSKATSNPIRVVVAVDAASPITRVEDLPNGTRVSTEYPVLTKRFFDSRGIEALIRRDRGEDSRDRGRDRRDHRDRSRDTTGRPSHHRDHSRVLHRDRREPGVVQRSRQGARDGPAEIAP